MERIKMLIRAFLVLIALILLFCVSFIVLVIEAVTNKQIFK